MPAWSPSSSTTSRACSTAVRFAASRLFGARRRPTHVRARCAAARAPAGATRRPREHAVPAPALDRVARDVRDDEARPRAAAGRDAERERVAAAVALPPPSRAAPPASHARRPPAVRDAVALARRARGDRAARPRRPRRARLRPARGEPSQLLGRRAGLGRLAARGRAVLDLLPPLHHVVVAQHVRARVARRRAAAELAVRVRHRVLRVLDADDDGVREHDEEHARLQQPSPAPRHGLPIRMAIGVGYSRRRLHEGERAISEATHTASRICAASRVGGDP